MKRLARVAAILWIALAAVSAPTEPIASLRASNYVNDFAGVLDAATQARLNDLCFQVEQKAHAQIAVVTVKSLDGAKGKDRGVLILLATEDRNGFITTGYGLEPILPDGKVGGFGREAVPFLKNGDDAGAVTLMTARVASVIAQDAGVMLDNQPQLAAPRQRLAPGGGLSAVVVILIIIFFIVLPILRAIFRGTSGGRGGGGSGFLSGLLWSMLFSNMGGGRGGFGGGGFGGGGFGGGGSGGGGFGGFGGGDTGGGGAGFSW
jgi:uncharacterized protein